MNLFEIAAFLTLNKTAYDKGISDAKKSATGLSGKLTSVMSTIGKSALAGLGAAAAGITSIVKQSVDAYGQYQQLLGGVKKIYGDDTAEKVSKNAGDAFKTVGISINDYFDNVSAFSTKLISDFGGDTEKAADYADKALKQVADNANTFGKYTVKDLTQVYQAFTRGNYTTLDNLNLGFAGSKSGMEDLLAKAEELSGVHYEMGNFADMIDAIGVIQESFNIAGTSATEAQGTITGSLSSAKAAWDNLVLGLSDPSADVGALISNVMESGITAIGNLLPTIGTALGSIGPMLEQIVPQLITTSVNLITENAPTLVDSVISLLGSLASTISDNSEAIVTAATGIVTQLLSAAPDVITSFVDIVNSIASGFLENADVIISAGTEIINSLITLLSEWNIEDFLNVAVSLLTKLADGLITNLPTLLPAVVGIIMDLCDSLTQPDMLDKLIATALDLMIALQSGIIGSIDKIIETAPKIIMNLVTALIMAAPQLLSAGLQMVVQMVTGIIGHMQAVLNVGKDVVDWFKNGFQEKVEGAKQWGKDLLDNFISGITEKFQALKDKVNGIAEFVKGILGHSHPEFGPMRDDYKWMPDMMDSLTKGIKDNESKFKRVASDALDLSDSITMPDAELNGTYTYSRANATDRINDLIEILEQYLPRMADMNITLDSGVLVGELTPAIDTALGARSEYVLRGNAV